MNPPEDFPEPSLPSAPINEDDLLDLLAGYCHMREHLGYSHEHAASLVLREFREDYLKE